MIVLTSHNMGDDIKKDPKSDHARQIKLERDLMDATGLTRSQIRVGLRAVGERVTQEQREAKPFVKPSPPKIGVEESKVGDAQANQVKDGGANAGAQGGGGSLPTIETLVIYEGFLWRANVSMTLIEQL